MSLVRSAFGMAGTALGGPLGGLVGAGIGAGLMGLAGRKKKAAGQTPMEIEQARLSATAARLNAQAAQSPFESAGYLARTGEARDAAREDAQSDAARAGVMGLSGGTAIAAGAGARSRALAGVQRSAVGDAENRQQQLLSLSAQLSGQQLDRAAQERALRAQQKGQFASTLAGLTGTAVQGYLGLQKQKRKAP